MILCGLFVWLIASNLNETFVYKETDRFSYYVFTDKEIRNAPRISKKYSFASHPGDGYRPSTDIIFRDVTHPEPLRTYLASIGYIRQKRRSVNQDVWCRPDKVCKDRYYLSVDKGASTVTLTKMQ